MKNDKSTIKPKKFKFNKEFFKSPFNIVVLFVLILYTISMLYPFVWTFVSSFKTRSDFIINRFGLPSEWRFSNYSEVINEFYIKVDTVAGGSRNVYFLELLFNSIFYTLGSTVVFVFSRACVAYVAAKFSKKYSFCKIFYPIVIVVMVLPIVGSLPAELKFLKNIGAYDNAIMLIIMKGGFTGTYFLVLFATFSDISDEYAEAAHIDGAGSFTVFFKVMLPLAKTSIMSIGVLQFIAFWNDWGVNIIYMPNFPMLSYALYYFRNNTISAISTIPHKLAACMIVTLPIVALFIALRKKFVGNLTMGGIKG